jgi:16S rRNA (guanine966-N2)-methyltransferase
MDSKLQIISGKHRGRKLRLPPDARPTQNRARIALFNMLESGIVDFNQNLSVWDAFAGSGAFGLECLSRYSNIKVVFTDIAPTSLKTVRDNLNTLGETAIVKQADAIASVAEFGVNSNLIFIDPPYADANLGGVFVHKLDKHAVAGTILIWEQEVGQEREIDETKWQILRDKRYGRARFLILQKI